MQRRGFLKSAFTGIAGAAILPGSVAAALPWTVDVCRWVHDHCAPYPPDQYYRTECGSDFLTKKGTREENEFLFCVYCGRRISEIKLKMGDTCGQKILDDLRREGVIG